MDPLVHQDDTGQETQRNDGAGPAFHRPPQPEIFDEEEQRNEEGPQGQEEAERNGQVEGLVGLRDEALGGMMKQLGQGVGRLAGKALGMRHVGIPDGKPQPADEQRERAAVLLQPQEFRDHGAPRNAELGDAAVEPAVREIIVDGVEALRGHALEPGVLPLDAPAEDHVEAALHGRPVELADFFRLVLQVAVHDHDPLAGGMFQAGRDGVLLAAVAGEAHALAPRIGGHERDHGCPGTVGTGVLDHDDFEVPGQGFERRNQAAAQLGQAGFGLVDRGDHGDERAGGVHVRFCPGKPPENQAKSG